MGAWGTGNWDNDSAMDWAAALRDEADIRRALRRLVEADEGCASTTLCCEALAAAEAVAASCGLPGPRLPARVAEWAARTRCEKALVDQALLAVVQVERSSELQELFDDGGRNDEWHEVVQELHTRLKRVV